MKLKNVALAARQVKAGPDDGLGEGEFTAYASVFGVRDSYGDVVVKGAFADDLKAWEESGNPIPLLFGHVMHDPDYNLGHVVRAVEDDRGLLVTAQLDLENPKAMQVYRMLKGRRVNQMSYAYDVLEGGDATRKRDDGSDEHYYELRKMHVYEVSVVTIGANQETEVLAVKSTADALAGQVKAGRTLSAKNESALREARDSIDSVLASLGASEDEKAAPAADPDQEASDPTEAKSSASDEEPSGAKSPAPDEEQTSGPSVDVLAATIRIEALKGAERSLT